jgi:hypothetical protein
MAEMVILLSFDLGGTFPGEMAHATTNIAAQCFRGTHVPSR